MTESSAILLAVLQTRIEALEAVVKKNEAVAHAELASALEAHRQLHVAHDVAHIDFHNQNQTAIERAAQQAKELAIVHANAHKREHELAQEAIRVAHESDKIRFEHLNEQAARSIEERSTFANKEATEDKIEALGNRISAVERIGQGSADRVALVNTTVNRVGSLEAEVIASRSVLAQVTSMDAKIEALEKARENYAGLNRGISAVWAVLIAVAALVIGAIGLLVRFSG